MATIDPRMLSQLLQLQFMQNIDLSGTADGTSGDGGSSADSFAGLLQGLLDQKVSSPEHKVIPAASLLAVRPAILPPSLAKPSAYDPLIHEASRQYGVDANLVKAVISAESSFNPQAVSNAGAKGLMQLMDGTGQNLGVADPFDPEQNIQGGTRFLADLLQKYNGNEASALAAYNAGPGRIDRLGVTDDAELRAKYSQLPAQTRSYVNKVLELKDHYAAGKG